MAFFQEFRVGELFDISHGKRLTKAKRMEGNIPFLTAGEQNQGVAEYVSNTESGLYTNPITIDMFGNCFYHSGIYSGDDNIYFFTNDQISERAKLFIVASLFYLKDQYSYGKQFRQSDADSLTLKLPVKLLPDFDSLVEVVNGIGGGIDMSKIDTSNWVEFRIGDVLERIPTNKIPGAISQYPKEPIDDCVLPAIAAGTKNQGIACYVPKENATVLEKCISIAANGDGVAFYQPNEFTILQDAYAVSVKNNILTEEIALFLVAEIQKILDQKYGWNNKSGWAKLKEDTILLPAKASDEPDWEYMQERIAELEQERIAELEQERIAELEQYLIATGLNDYTLTEEEKKVLSEVEGASRRWEEFRIGELFEKKTIKGYPKKDTVLKESNNGYHIFGQNIKYQYDKKFLIDDKYLHVINPQKPILAYTSSVGEIGMIEESFYRSGDNGAFQGLFPREHCFTKYELLFILSILKKQFDTFTYSTGMANVLDLTISLPVDSNGSPDWDFMEAYVKAMEKVVIEDVVKYKDQVIEKTREVVG